MQPSPARASLQRQAASNLVGVTTNPVMQARWVMILAPPVAPAAEMAAHLHLTDLLRDQLD